MVAGSRVPVRRLWGFFRNGVKVETILRRYPQLGAAKVLDALAFALDNPEIMTADLAREQALLHAAGESAAEDRNPVQISLPFVEKE